MSLALGLVSRLMTRGLYSVLNTLLLCTLGRTLWYQMLSLTKEALEKIDFTISQFNGQNIYGPNHQHSSWFTQMPVLQTLEGIQWNMVVYLPIGNGLSTWPEL